MKIKCFITLHKNAFSSSINCQLNETEMHIFKHSDEIMNCTCNNKLHFNTCSMKLCSFLKKNGQYTCIVLLPERIWVLKYSLLFISDSDLFLKNIDTILIQYFLNLLTFNNSVIYWPWHQTVMYVEYWSDDYFSDFYFCWFLFLLKNHFNVQLFYAFTNSTTTHTQPKTKRSLHNHMKTTVRKLKG